MVATDTKDSFPLRREIEREREGGRERERKKERERERERERRWRTKTKKDEFTFLQQPCRSSCVCRLTVV